MLKPGYMTVFLKVLLLVLLPAFLKATGIHMFEYNCELTYIKNCLTSEPRPETVDLLISQGYNLDGRDEVGNTVLHVAAGLDHSLFLKVHSLYPN